MTTSESDLTTSGADATGPEPAAPAAATPLAGRLRRRTGSLLVVVFALVLALPWAVGGRGGATENRAAQPLPSFGPGTVLEEQTYRQVDAALRDRLTLRSDVIKAVAAAGYDTSGLSLNTRVHAGDDDELFVADDYTSPCKDKLNVNGLAQHLRALSDAAGGTPGAVTFIVAPDKSSVLPDRVGPFSGSLLRCSDSQRGRIERLAAAETDRVIDLFPRAEAMRAAQPGTELYTKVDTHWTPQLATTLGATLVPQLAEQTGATGVRWTEPVKQGSVHYGDLLALLGVGSRPQLRDRLVGDRPGAVTERSRIDVPGGRPVWVTETTGVPVIGGRTLFVYDSFTAERGFGNDFAAPQLIPYFGHATWVHWNDLKALIASGRLPKSDRIVLESVQRGVGGITDTILFNTPVATGLRGSLEP
jgi:hypothetical protein